MQQNFIKNKENIVILRGHFWTHKREICNVHHTYAQTTFLYILYKGQAESLCFQVYFSYKCHQYNTINNPTSFL